LEKLKQRYDDKIEDLKHEEKEKACPIERERVKEKIERLK